jgi:hypothetical protein
MSSSINNPPYVDKDSREVMATPKDNLQLAKKILDERQDPAAIAQVKQLLGKAMEQQDRADTSQRLASETKACMSSACKENPTTKLDPKDHYSHTGSTERRRKDARNWKDPIPISSGSAKDKGKAPKYHGADKYRYESPPPCRTNMPPPRHGGYAGNAKPHSPGGINIRDHVEPRGSRDDGRDEHARRRSHHSDGENKHHGDGYRKESRWSRSKQDGHGESHGGDDKKRPPRCSPTPPSDKGGGGGKGPARSDRLHH